MIDLYQYIFRLNQNWGCQLSTDCSHGKYCFPHRNSKLAPQIMKRALSFTPAWRMVVAAQEGSCLHGKQMADILDFSPPQSFAISPAECWSPKPLESPACICLWWNISYRNEREWNSLKVWDWKGNTLVRTVQ